MAEEKPTTDAVYEPGTAFADAVDTVAAGEFGAREAAAALLARLSEAEKLFLLDGDLSMSRGLLSAAKGYNRIPYEAGRIDRLGIPGIRFSDGPRGVVMGSSTAFPAAISRAASWDVDLERRIGAAIGAEARAQGANLFAGVCVNLAPAPGWGRSQESYGEDPVLLGAMGAALVHGARPWVMTCVKHFALNSMEEARFQVDVRVAEDVLREVYLPHFRTVIEAGADAVMSAYNSVNGEWAGQNRHLLTEILREDWGFTGFVMTDFVWGLRDPIGSVAAGQDLEMPFRQQRAAALPRALREGRLRTDDVEQAGIRLIAAQVALALRAEPTPDLDVVACAEHRALAREAARRGSVLLRNEHVAGEPALPLTGDAVDRVAVLGRRAATTNLGDNGSSKVHPPVTTSVLEGMRARLGDRVVHADEHTAAVAAAQSASAAVVVVGLGAEDEGEALVAMDADAVRLFGGITRWRPVAGVLSKLTTTLLGRAKMGGDRRDLRLHPDDIRLIEDVRAVNDRTIVVIVGGGTVVLDPWDRDVAAVLLAWYPGMEGGHAITDILLGDSEPGGRLPVVIPRRQADLPAPDWAARTIEYGRWWGQRTLDRDGIEPAYPLGFGLGYTTFAFDDLQIGPVNGDRFGARVTVANTGDRPGRHVVQIYAVSGTDLLTVRELVGFRAVQLDPGRRLTIEIDCTTRPLQRWVGNDMVTPTAEFAIEAAAYCGDPHGSTATLSLTR
ncbi:glycoside hydrolase family 3 C-terminal domain-containing protein [Nocardia sp. NPDC058518]|uniref:glycoside hydrolase family 3 protein n=1 Tax=Nocardia sp. NPDC058518 TaxID=3346534 RepID=UPI003650EC83